MNQRFYLLTLFALLGLGWSTTHLSAQKNAGVPDPDPELERKSFKVADGFEVNLYAADPLLTKPIQMNFDAAGRLWLACSETYPQIKPGQVANDKIIVLEDTKGAGRADKVSVFADGLFIPTGLEPGDNGVYVANSTELLHLSDPKGTGKATQRKVLLSGFGTEDTHHILHTLRWGHDGLLYMNQSIYIHSHIETPHGVRRLNGGGIWRFRPSSYDLEVFARGWVNTWGHHFDRWGQSFVTDGAGGEGINYAIPGAYYVTAVGASRILPGLNPGSPKYCGAEIVSGRHLPDDWQGNIITNDFRGHRVCRYVIKEDGSGYATQQQADVIATSHGAFRPIDVKMGPDGAIYIADWYNPIIQHGEVDFRDPRRDITHGRIWRVTAKNRPLVARPKLVSATPQALCADLAVPEGWTRHFARRVLTELGKEKTVPAVLAWVKSLDPKEAEYEHHLLEAAWTLQAVQHVEPTLLKQLVQAKSPQARAAAVRLLSTLVRTDKSHLPTLAERVRDEHPRVRLEAVRALGQVPAASSVLAALSVLDLPMDRFLDYSLWLTVRELEPSWLPELKSGQLPLAARPEHLLFALQASGSREAVPALMQLLRDKKIPKQSQGEVLALLAAVGGQPELTYVFEQTLAEQTPPEQKLLLAQALEKAIRQRALKPTGDLSRVGMLLSSEHDTLRSTGAHLAGLWKVEGKRADLVKLAQAEQQSLPVRQASLAALAELGGPETKEALLNFAGEKYPWQIRNASLSALSSFDLAQAARLTADLFAASPTGYDPSDLIVAFVERKAGAQTLVSALADKKIPADLAKLAVRSARATGRQVDLLQAALAKSGNLAAASQPLTEQERAQLLADVVSKGDPVRGEAIYRRADQLCMKCHAVGGAGGQVGPDFSSIGASAPVDYLLDSLLLPNKAVKEGYHSLNVGLKSGKLVTGVKLRESKEELVLRTAEDSEVVIPIKQIDERGPGRSLMPDGLTEPLTRAELVDLVRFLSELGKQGPYTVSKARLVRRWEVLNTSPAAQAQLLRVGYASATSPNPAYVWSSAYSTVAGALPLAELPKLQVRKQLTPETNAVSFVRCQLEVTTAGKCQLKFADTKGLSLWVGQTPAEVKAAVELDLPVGLHTLTLAVQHNQATSPLKLELDEVPNSQARVHLRVGK